VVIVHLVGGLGNQLFQYACGRSVALRWEKERGRKVVFKLDLSAFQTHYTLHKYSLHHLCIKENIASQKEIAELRPVGKLGHLRALVDPWIKKRFEKTRFQEKGLTFDRSIFEKKPPLYLEGYWQTEKYFNEIASVLREEFKVKTEPSSRNREWADRIAGCESVSLHVRRADYVSNNQTQSLHGTCDMGYYREAVAQMAKSVRNPHIFVFADDPVWAAEHVRFDFPTFYVADNNAETNYEDFRLMSLCSHNIIANSTFSWWGAWMNPNPKKRVVAPRQWFQDLSKDASDLVPENWVRI